MANANSKKIIPISDTQAAIGAGALMAFFVVWALIAGMGDTFVNWIGGKDNISGWVQAFGSIAAIVGTFSVAKYQIDRQKHDEKKTTVLMVRTLVSSAMGCAEILRDQQVADKWTMLRLRAMLKTTYSSAEQINSHLLKIEWTASVMTARNILAQLEVLCEAVAENPDYLTEARKMAYAFCTQLSLAENVVRKKHPGVYFTNDELSASDSSFFDAISTLRKE
ncbi:hypothetical protein JQN63_20390 [Delftia lacustris]|uniref:hypothetical protein n=1 Tax=Delftia lacustris TaxID=558537 RepID=UPI00193BF3E9|nr:hypothetical protein [Delftia lacustris]QRI88692.1 hypothetical protein JQN63_20390 [Delftia lacustris]